MRTRSQRPFAFAAVFVYLAGTGAGLFHEASVQHVQCAEHGQLEDRPAQQRVSQAPPPSGADLWSTAPGARDGEAHEHCGIPDGLQRPRTFAATPGPLPPPTHRLIVCLATPERSAAPAAVHRIAPKQSPPV